MLTKSNAAATAILAIVYLELSETEIFGLCVEPYLNGRENGFAVNFYGKSAKAVFSTERRTDNAVVYLGKTTNFNFGGNVPDEQTYKEGMSFNYKELHRAADFVCRHLRKN